MTLEKDFRKGLFVRQGQKDNNRLSLMVQKLNKFSQTPTRQERMNFQFYDFSGS